MNTIRVGVSEMAVARRPDRLETLALGSCVGISLYDRTSGIGGLIHAMLPDGSVASSKTASNPCKFVTSGLTALTDKMMKVGADVTRLKAKIAGGANMFPDVERKDEMHIGLRNVAAAREFLKENNIEILAEDVGGSVGRTVMFDTADGSLNIRRANMKNTVI